MSAATKRTVAILATLDTKAAEAGFLREQIRALGGDAVLFDVGVIGAPGIPGDHDRGSIAAAGGTSLADLLQSPTRERSTPVMVRGALSILEAEIAAGRIHGVLGLGGLQGTALATEVMQALPYGFPKVMVSTVASGDTSAYVGIKDVTMMFSVGDLLGLNPFSRRLLANAAGAVWGMACAAASVAAATPSDRPMIGMTNLGVLTRGAMRAIERFEAKGYEVIVFHAVGSGGRAMEQMMKEGLIGAVFDYALGEISDEVFGALRAAGPERLTVAGSLGLPQVVCPGGAEHLGVLVDPPNSVPDRWKDHVSVFHSPVVFVPRLGADELRQVAGVITERLRSVVAPDRCVFMIPTAGTGSYAVPGGPLHDPAADVAFFTALREGMPEGIECVDVEAGAEDPDFVDAAVDRLIALIEEGSR